MRNSRLDPKLPWLHQFSSRMTRQQSVNPSNSDNAFTMKALKNYFVSEHPVDQINTPGSRSESESSRRSSTNHRKSSSLKSQSSQQPPRTNNKPDTCLPVWAGQDLGPVADIRAEIMVQNLWQDQLRRVYASGFDPEEGAVLKKGRGDYICAPASLETIPNGFFEMVRQLNVSVGRSLPACRSQPLIWDSVPLQSTHRLFSPSC